MKKHSALSLKGKRVTLVLNAQDLRAGFTGLSRIAGLYLGIDVYKKKDCIVFVSRTRSSCKIITCDESGSTLITRKLNKGRFEKFLSNNRPEKPLTISELTDFLNGDHLTQDKSKIEKI